MYKATRTGFFTLACQTGRVHLTEGEPVPSSVRADSIKRFLVLGVIEKISEKDFVKETKVLTAKEKKAKKEADKLAGVTGDDKGDDENDNDGDSENDTQRKPDAPAGEPVE